MRARRGRLFCPLRRGNGGCRSPPFPEAVLASAVPVEAFQAHLAAAARMREADLAQQMEADYALRLRQELARAEEARRLGAAAARLEPHRRRCAEEILTLRCPRCQMAFIDFGAGAKLMVGELFLLLRTGVSIINLAAHSISFRHGVRPDARFLSTRRGVLRSHLLAVPGRLLRLVPRRLRNGRAPARPRLPGAHLAASSSALLSDCVVTGSDQPHVT